MYDVCIIKLDAALPELLLLVFEDATPAAFPIIALLSAALFPEARLPLPAYVLL